MFWGATNFNQDIGDWNTSNVTDMTGLFYEATSFNQDIGAWDVSKVTSMYATFWDADAFNQNIGDWDVSSLTYMYGIFAYADSFNQDISRWDVSHVTNMQYIFYDANSFDQDIDVWDTSSVTEIDAAFMYAGSFNQDISDWDVSHVADLGSMFYSSAFKQDISDWNISNVTNFSSLVSGYALSTSQYDSMLTRWSQSTPQSNIGFSVWGANYCEGEAGKTTLLDTYSWSIQDSGQNCNYYISSPDTVEVASGSQSVGSVTVASDINVSDVNFEIMPVAEGALFSITENGVLSFIEAPDFNNPVDRNRDNVYRVQVRAYDTSETYEDLQTIRVQVLQNSNTLVPTIMFLLN